MGISMQKQEVKSSLNMDSDEKQFEYVVMKIQEIYNFNPEDEVQLILYREFIKNVILMLEKAKSLNLSEYGEQ